MHRFFLDPELVTRPVPARIMLPDKEAHQVRDVLRLSIGERLILLDNSGDELLASVINSSRSGIEVELLERRAGKPEPSVRIILCQGLLKSARFEWILEKGVELGVATFMPILCRRSLSGLEEASPAKMLRWKRIIQEAAEQCGRPRLPKLLAIRPLIQALNRITPETLALMPWEEERSCTLRAALSTRISPPPGTVGTPFMAPTGPDMANEPVGAPFMAPTGPGGADPLTIMLFIGPEGGLDPAEVALAQQHGAQIVTLGPRILRAETAALAAVANIMYELEQ